MKCLFNLIMMCVIVLISEDSFAASIGEFSGPIDKVMNTITGPLGKSVSIIAIAIGGITFWLKGADLGEGLKTFLGLIVAIAMIALASPIIDSVFQFSSSGALI